MTLKDHLYRIVSRSDTDDGATFVVRLLADCFIFRAHFPSQPVMPGVCIVQTATELMEERLSQRLTICRIKNVKFLSVISPDNDETLIFRITRLTVSENGGTVSAQIAVSGAEGPKAKISLTCEAARPER